MTTKNTGTTVEGLAEVIAKVDALVGSQKQAHVAVVADQTEVILPAEVGLSTWVAYYQTVLIPDSSYTFDEPTRTLTLNEGIPADGQVTFTYAELNNGAA